MMRPLISIISPCYNEEENVELLYGRVVNIINAINAYDFEYIFIDNCSTDGTVEILKRIANNDPRIKIIINNRNYGHIRSPYWGLMQTKGVASIYLASDLQDPPELIPEFINAWNLGYKVVLGVKPVSDENKFLAVIRRAFYRFLNLISEVPLTNNSTGFGLYDQSVVRILREVNDPYPYLRGLIDELGFSKKTIEFKQPMRLKGITKNNFFSLYDIAVLGVISHSLVPIRLIFLTGLCLVVLSFFSLIIFLLALILIESIKISFMVIFSIAFFMISGLIICSIGIVGEYVGSIHRYSKKRPIVTEMERFNFD